MAYLGGGGGWVEHSSFWPDQISHGIEIDKVKHGMPLSEILNGETARHGVAPLKP